MNSLEAIFASLASVVITVTGFSASPVDRGSGSASSPNVLFIAIDDLRPAIGAYGVLAVRTPRIDALAKQGVVFDRAYCQQALCNPSRASMLTGLRPDTVGVTDLKAHFRDNRPEVVTLPQWFKMNGYEARSVGKIYHDSLPDPVSWSQPAEFISPKFESMEARKLLPAWEGTHGDPQEINRDYQVATRGVELIGELAGQGEPFFLAVGFMLPHLPWIAPHEYFELYQDSPLAPFPPRSTPEKRPVGAPHAYRYSEFGQYNESRDWDAPENQPDAVRAYYASVSFVDALVGRLLDALSSHALTENTIVVIWGDHGFHLGEQGAWGKVNSNFEIAVRAPLIISAPGFAQNEHAPGIVEFIDIYPTLCDIAGLPVPDHLQGTSLLPQLKDPSAPGRTAVFSQQWIPPGNQGTGYSVRTSNYRYTEWRFRDTNPSDEIDDSRIIRELYDVSEGGLEEVNIADDIKYTAIVEEHAQLLDSSVREWQRR